MKLLIAFVAILLVGCASNRAVSYQQLDSIRVGDADCPRIDEWVNFSETQLKAKGLLYADPATLNDEDRLYNAKARIIIWSLRIGCANPNRYKS
jgi:hypothetical protein